MLTEKFWERYFKVYDILNIVIPYQELMGELEKELDLDQEDVVLDVGSGTGNLMIRIKGKCKKIIGIDYSSEGIKRHKEKDPSANVILHNITQKFPFSDNYFSKIVSNNTIYTLSEDGQKKALREIYRVLKPGGKFVISNLKKDYSPFEVYFTHVKKSIRKQGFLKTLFLIVRMIFPTLKMFYYNSKIKRSGLENKYNFLSSEQQKELLEKAGFKNIFEGKPVFAGQGILNSGFK